MGLGPTCRFRPLPAARGTRAVNLEPPHVHRCQASCQAHLGAEDSHVGINMDISMLSIPTLERILSEDGLGSKDLKNGIHFPGLTLVKHRMALAKLAKAALGCNRKLKCSAPPVQLPGATAGQELRVKIQDIQNIPKQSTHQNKQTPRLGC